MTAMTTLPDIPLPSTIHSRFVENINGLRMHVLEAGFETSGRRCLLLLHGFPELAYSWRKVMPQLAAAGYHVIAPDQRGYGRTTGWQAEYDSSLHSFRLLNLVRDALSPPRKHYQWYYSTREANADMAQAPQGVHDFLRAYYHHKSADWPGNRPTELQGRTATELAKLPTYYVMELGKNMAETVAAE